MLMGNQSSAVPPRSPAPGSQPSSQGDSVYETYQVPFALAKEINRLCSEFQKLQQAVDNGSQLPPRAVFEVDLLQLIRLTNPTRLESLNVAEQTSLSSQSSSRAQPAVLAPPPSVSHLSPSNQRNVSFRDPSNTMILKLNKNQLQLLQEESSQSGYSESVAFNSHNRMLSSELNSDAAAAGSDGHPRLRLAAVSHAMLASSALQRGGVQYSARQAQQQLSERPGSYDDSASKRDERIGAASRSASGASAHSVDDGSMRSFQQHHTPVSNSSAGFSAGNIDSRFVPRSAGPPLDSRYVNAPDYSDADSRVASTSSTPNSVSYLASSQSLIGDDVEAKRTILAEV